MGFKTYRRHSVPNYRFYRRTPILIRTAGVVFLFLTLHLLLLQLRSQEALKAKYTATDFGSVQFSDITLDEGTSRREELLAARPQWKHLGSGFEGSTFIWQGNVIKTFHLKHSPLRNCMPIRSDGDVDQDDSSERRWPAEIPASLLLGNNTADGNNTGSGFLPVTDFFRVAIQDDESPKWHLVTPLMSGGTLETLARAVAADRDSMDIREIDLRYRPSFVDLLSTLDEMHSHGLCHDDVKPNNIFIGDDAKWLLGDMGNAREISHPFHSSRIWQANHQVTDCRANDVLRTIKTYLLFLQAASLDSSAFNTMLFEAKEPWARLYWMAVEAGTALSATEVQRWSEVIEAPDNPPHFVSRYERVPKGLWNPVSRLWYGRKRIMQRAVEVALGLGMSEGWNRILAMTAFFGLPAQSCPISPLCLQEGATLGNAIIGKDQVEGLHWTEHCTLEDVWFEDVREDALSIKNDEPGSETWVIGSGAYNGDDKIVQHNGCGAVNIMNIYIENYGKLYRSCDKCSRHCKRNVYIEGVTPRVGGELAGINTAFGDTATSRVVASRRSSAPAPAEEMDCSWHLVVLVTPDRVPSWNMCTCTSEEDLYDGTYSVK